MVLYYNLPDKSIEIKNTYGNLENVTQQKYTDDKYVKPNIYQNHVALNQILERESLNFAAPFLGQPELYERIFEENFKNLSVDEKLLYINKRLSIEEKKNRNFNIILLALLFLIIFKLYKK